MFLPWMRVERYEDGLRVGNDLQDAYNLGWTINNKYGRLFGGLLQATAESESRVTISKDNLL